MAYVQDWLEAMELAQKLYGPHHRKAMSARYHNIVEGSLMKDETWTSP
jgi:hypothetical protein